MRWTPRGMRIGLMAAFAIPTMIILLAGSLQAQFRPPQPPPPIPRPPIPQPPPFQPPVIQPPKIPTIERIWTCSKCRAEIGRGAFPPGTCPNCGVRIINGVGGPNPPGPNPMPPPFVAPPVNVGPPPVQNVGNDTNKAPQAQPQAPAAGRSMSGFVVVAVIVGVLLAGLSLVVIGGGVLFLVMKKKPQSGDNRTSKRKRA